MEPDPASCSARRRCQGGSDIGPGGVPTGGVTVRSQVWPDAGQAHLGAPQGDLTDRAQGSGAGEARGSPGAPPHSCTASEGNTQPPKALPRKMLAAVTSGSALESVLGTESRLHHPESWTLP